MGLTRRGAGARTRSRRPVAGGAAIAALLVVVAAGVVPPPAAAAPVCAGVDKVLCGGRTFPEPSASLTALTHAETAAGLRSLAAEFPDHLTVTDLGDSFDGAEVLMAELTAPGGEVPVEDRTVVLVVQSIHGNEPGGREGGVRYLEDLLRGDDPARAALLERVRLVQVLPNPDGWRAGDHDAVPDGDSIGVWARGNGNGAAAASDVGGVDLNRNAPWRGPLPTDRPDPLSEPETQVLVEEVRRRLDAGQDIQASADVHGEVTETAAWIMLSSGEFDLQQMTQQRLQADAVDAAVTEALEGEPLLDLAAMLGQLVEPAFVTASSEFGAPGVGGSGTGFVGDWIAQGEGGGSASISTIELFAADASGPGLNSLTARRDVLQLYRETVRAILGELIDQAVVDHVPAVDLDGRVGYVRDPAVVVDPVLGEPRTPMRFFEDLGPYVDQPLIPLDVQSLATADLSGLDAIVVASDVVPAAGVAALRSWAEAGGRLVLTDGALTALPAVLPGIAAAHVATDLADITPVDLEPFRDDPLLAGVRDTAFLLTEPATLGYDTAGGTDTPAWHVDRAAWEAAGGRTAGTIGGATAIGRAPLGSGSVAVIGQLLPPPRAEGRILYGINDHAVLDTGYQVLLNALGAAVAVEQRDALAPDPGPVVDPAIDVDLGAAADRVVLGDVVPLDVTVTAGEGTAAEALEVVVDLPADVRPAGHLQGCAVRPADDGEGGEGGDGEGGDGGWTVSCPVPGGLPDGGRAEVGIDVVPTRVGRPVVAATAVAGPAARASRPGAEDVVAGTGPRQGGEAPAAEPAALELLVDPPASLTGRVAGAERTATAVAASQASWLDGGASAVVVATAADFPDALAGGALAAAARGPLLLTDPASLPPAVAAEVDRVLGDDATVYVLGGERAVSAGVASALAAPGRQVVRLGGDSRFATAVAVAEETVLARSRAAGSDGGGDGGVGPVPTTVYLATGADFPDALAAGAAAAQTGGVVLLTDGPTVPPATREYLDRAVAGGAATIAVGGDAAQAAPDAEPVVGSTRYDTAARLASRTVPSAQVVAVATGERFPDALAGVAHIALRAGPVLLVDRDRIPPETQAWLAGADVRRAVLFGGASAISGETAEAVRAAAVGG